MNSLNIYKASNKHDETFHGKCLTHVIKAEPALVLLSGRWALRQLVTWTLSTWLVLSFLDRPAHSRSSPLVPGPCGSVFDGKSALLLFSSGFSQRALLLHLCLLVTGDTHQHFLCFLGYVKKLLKQSP